MTDNAKNLVRFVGDIHGKWYEYQMILQDCEHPSVQVGDFGVGFHGPYWEDRVNDFHASGQHRFIRGNHDKPETCKDDMVGCIGDGVVENDVMYIGGAWSIDRDYRTPGVDWWHDEELTQDELDVIASTYTIMKPRILVTHDCPTLAAYYMFVKDGHSLSARTLYLSRTGETLQRMFETHQPELWLHGHWHLDRDRVINGTRFLCLGELAHVDVDICTLEVFKPQSFRE